jgi:hypothetical protein
MYFDNQMERKSCVLTNQNTWFAQYFDVISVDSFWFTNISASEFCFYLLVILFATIQLCLVFRYFMRLQIYFNSV